MTLQRREVLAVAGGGAAVLVAGCTGDDNDNDDDDLEEADWEGIDRFSFEGTNQAWTGIEPSIIEDEDNPTIGLIEGETYDFHWINADGSLHNIEIRNEDGDVVGDYSTDGVSGEDEEETLEGVEATSEMAQYVCDLHDGSQVGDIVVF